MCFAHLLWFVVVVTSEMGKSGGFVGLKVSRKGGQTSIPWKPVDYKSFWYKSQGLFNSSVTKSVGDRSRDTERVVFRQEK